MWLAMSRHPRQTVALHVRIDPKLKDRLRVLADRDSRPESVVVEEALAAYVEREAKK